MEELPIIKPPDPSVSDIESHEQLAIEWAMETISSDKHPSRNEDAILISPEDKTFGVFDGVSGKEAGDVASTTARDYVLVNLNKIPSGIDVSVAKGILSEIIIGAHQAVNKVSETRTGYPSRISTTATVFKIHRDMDGKNWVVIANIGDGRVYKINSDNTLQQITIDDDLLSKSELDSETKDRIARNIAIARKIKDLENDAIFYYRMRNIITKSLGKRGGDGLSRIDIVLARKGDRFLITSDGIHDNLTTDEIRETIEQSQTLAEIAKNLKDRSLARSREPEEKEMRAKPDDMSVVVVECK